MAANTNTNINSYHNFLKKHDKSKTGQLYVMYMMYLDKNHKNEKNIQIGRAHV